MLLLAALACVSLRARGSSPARVVKARRALSVARAVIRPTTGRGRFLDTFALQARSRRIALVGLTANMWIPPSASTPQSYTLTGAGGRRARGAAVPALGAISAFRPGRRGRGPRRAAERRRHGRPARTHGGAGGRTRHASDFPLVCIALCGLAHARARVILRASSDAFSNCICKDRPLARARRPPCLSVARARAAVANPVCPQHTPRARSTAQSVHLQVPRLRLQTRTQGDLCPTGGPASGPPCMAPHARHPLEC